MLNKIRILLFTLAILMFMPSALTKAAGDCASGNTFSNFQVSGSGANSKAIVSVCGANVDAVQFTINNQNLGGPVTGNNGVFTTTFDATKLNNGSNTLSAQTVINGETAEGDSIILNVTNGAPTLTNPAIQTGPTDNSSASLPDVNQNDPNCTFNKDGYQICNPLPKIPDLRTFLLKIAQFILGAIGIISIVVIMYGGGRMLISGGDPGAIKVGRNAITWAIIGLVVSALAYSIIAIVQGILSK